MNKRLLSDSRKYLAIKKKKAKIKCLTILTALAVAAVTAFVLILPAMSDTSSVYCSLQEHTHTDSCYERVLTCTLAEKADGGEGASDSALQTEETAHTHTDSCYERVLVCTLSEHVHGLACMSDPNADTETREQWEAELSELILTGVEADDLLAVAKTQLGYRESSANYLVAEDGVTKMGYTRYGAACSRPYEEWNLLFLSFCMTYAKTETLPVADTLFELVSAAKEQGIYMSVEEYTPSGGDILLLDYDKDGEADRVAVAESFDKETATLMAIEGDHNGSVAIVEYPLAEGEVVGYVKLYKDPAQLQEEQSRLTSVSASYVWPEEEGADRVSVSLLVNGEPTEKSAVLSAENGWSCLWEDLDRYGEDGSENVYTVAAESVSGYNTTVQSAETEEGAVSFTLLGRSCETTVNVTVKKEWSVPSDEYLPQSLTVTLLQNGAPYGQSVVLSAENGWTYCWEGLCATLDGSAVTYTVDEEQIAGFKNTVTATEGENESLEILSLGVWSPDHITLELKLTDAEDPTVLLTGAVFQCYRVTAEGTEGAVLCDSDRGIYGVPEESAVTNDGAAQLTSLLCDGTYILLQTDSAFGYGIPTEPVLISAEKTENGEYLLSATLGEQSLSVTKNAQSSFTLELTNRECYILPDTGGIGVAPYYVSGIALVALAICLIYLQKNKKQKTK